MFKTNVYLAGFDVFRRDARERGEYLKALCAKQGLRASYPLDNSVPPGLTGPEAAQWICEQNMKLLVKADVCLANLDPFRGSEPDSGTVFEVGVATAYSIPVWAYFSDHREMLAQVPNDDGLCPDGFAIEDFGLPRNLMLACQWAGSSNTVEQAVADLARFLGISAFLTQHPRFG